MFLPHDDKPVTLMPKEFGGRKLESTMGDGSDLGDEDEKNKLEELKVIIVFGGRRVHQEVMNGVKVTKTVVGAIQGGQNPRHVCLSEGVCLVARVNTGSAVQQCNSAADRGWRIVPDAILRRHRRAPQKVPARTPPVHWGLNGRKAVGGPFGSDSRYTANKFSNLECPEPLPSTIRGWRRDVTSDA